MEMNIRDILKILLFDSSKERKDRAKFVNFYILSFNINWFIALKCKKAFIINTHAKVDTRNLKITSKIEALLIKCLKFEGKTTDIIKKKAVKILKMQNYIISLLYI